MIELIGFDGDDTLWHSEVYYERAHAQFGRERRDVEREQCTRTFVIAAMQRDLRIEQVQAFGFVAVQAAPLDVAERAFGRLDVAAVAQRFGRAQPVVGRCITAMRAREREELGRGCRELPIGLQPFGVLGLFDHRRTGRAGQARTRAECKQESERRGSREAQRTRAQGNGEVQRPGRPAEHLDPSLHA